MSGTEKKLHILFVEDSVLDYELGLRELRRAGFVVTGERIQTPAELEAVSLDSYELVLSDYKLPEWDGLGVLTAIHERKALLPVVIVSGSLGDEAAVECIKRGAADYVLKNNMVRLPFAVKRALQQSSERRSRHQAEEALRKSEERYRIVSTTTSDVVWDWDVATGTVERSGTLQSTFGFTSTEVEPTLSWWQARMAPEERKAVVESLMAAVSSTKNEWSAEYRFQRQNGSFALVYDHAVFMRDDQGQAVRVIGTMQDITERRSLEEQLRQSQKIDAIGQLAGGIAHDFNNILGIILGQSELLIDKLPSDSPTARRVEKIKTAAQRAAALTRQLLAFSRKQVLEMKTVSLNGVVSQSLDLLRRLIGEHIQIVTVLDPELGSMRADRGQLDQVIMNLTVNARDAMPSGGVLTIETKNVSVDGTYSRQRLDMAPGEYVCLIVSDTGCGMPSAVRDRVFEPFFTTKTKDKGTGLGLSMVHGIVKQSGGHIWVYSEVDKGTTFKIFYPRVNYVAEEEEIAQTVTDLRGTETILVAEDEEGFRELIVEILKACGYDVLEAENGKQALDLASDYRGQIDLLITDVIMPSIGGPELARGIKRQRADIRILFLSGYTDDVIKRDGFIYEEVRLLQKPFTPIELSKAVREALG